MAVSTASTFRPTRKQTLSSSGSTYIGEGASNHALQSPSSIPPSPSPLPPSSWNASTSTLGSTVTRNANDGGIGSSLINATGPGGAVLTAGAPIAANTIGNKPAIAGSSLYQACLTLLDRLWCVPHFGETFLLTPEEAAQMAATGEKRRPEVSLSDPVTQLWQCFRLGAPLCWLFNQLHPRTELPINPDANRSNANECKRQVAKFIIALNNELGWDPSDIFTVSQLYLNDTNGFVKVVRTISKLLDVFEARGLLIEAPKTVVPDELQKPTNDRAWIVRELLDTERKYVQDLEVLQNYARALQQNSVISPDTIHNLFGNLNTLVDVQRRFLICVEENVRRPPDDQHFGHVFRTMESDFAVYEPFCANYAQALDIINAEAPNLVLLRGMQGAEECYLDPAYELPTFLIKPVQRICKYPLLLESLLKKTPADAPYYQELVDGLHVIRRITDKVNETRRLQENIQIVRDLEERVEDWKGHNINTFGNLLLSDIFMVSKSDTEREYHVYLFEKILLCCKEVLPNQPKKNAKSNSLLKQKSSISASVTGKKSRTPLQLKGRIFINNVTSAIANSKVGSVLGTGASGQYSLQVWWRGDLDQESFSLRCKNEEQLKQWQLSIGRLIEEVNVRRQHIAAHYGQAGLVSPVGYNNMAGAGANGRRSGSGTTSLFPQTPATDVAPAFPFSTRADSQLGMYRGSGEEEGAGMAGSVPMDGSQLSVEGVHHTQGRLTPLGGRYSQPAEQRERQVSLSNDTRPRARTEDQDSATMTQWRSHSPAVQPPLPRNPSTSSTGEAVGSVAGLHQLRSATSNRQLRQGSSGAPHAFPRPQQQMRKNDMGQDIDATAEQVESLTMHNGRPRVDSSSSRGTMSSDMHQSRTRTGSNAAPSGHAPPPLPMGAGKANFPAAGYGGMAQGAMDAMAGANNAHLAGTAVNRQRFSSSSISTVDSQRSSRSRPGSTAASSPATLGAGGINVNGNGGPYKGPSNGVVGIQHANMAPSAGPTRTVVGGFPGPGAMPSANHGQPNSAAVKLVIHNGDDRLVVVVLATVTLFELTEKVNKKIRLVSGRRVENLKIRYVDEDGDRILMQDDEDVQMAFESSRQLGKDVDLIVS